MDVIGLFNFFSATVFGAFTPKNKESPPFTTGGLLNVII
jgi:hypothetical protein